MIFQKWNNQTNEWESERKILHTYDDFQNITYSLIQEWDGSSWNTLQQIFYTYDENGNCIYELTEDWFENEWLNCEQVFYTYDENNKLTELLWQNWKTDEWVDYYIEEHDYDENENLIRDYVEAWEIFHGIEQIEYFWSEFPPTNIAETINSQINIYPNPAIETITISRDVLLENTNINIYSVTGKLVNTSTLNNSGQIDISYLPKGVYFLNINTEKENFTKKFIKN